MKILFSEKNFYPLRGGADISAYALLKELAKKHDVHAMCVADADRKLVKDGITIHQKRMVLPLPDSWAKVFIQNVIWKRIFEKFIKKSKPDLILAHLELTPSITKVAIEYNIPYIIFIRDCKHFCPLAFRHKNPFDCKRNCFVCSLGRNKIQYFFWKKLLNEHKRALKLAYKAVANCYLKADIAKMMYDVDCEVMYPFVELEKYKVKKWEPRFVTFIKPMFYKGVKIFIDIAKTMKETEFLVVGRTPQPYKDQLLNLQNVRYVEWESDMRKIYSQTKILLIPSLGPEAFVRVGPEAMINGVPCIVGKCITETIDGGGIRIENTFDIDAWVDAINKLKNDKALYNKVSKKAKKKAKMFDFKVQYKKFEKILMKIS